jgi:hypothetical protein
MQIRMMVNFHCKAFMRYKYTQFDILKFLQYLNLAMKKRDF